MTKELKLPVAWMPTRPNRNSPTKLPSTPRTALRANDVSVPIKRPAMYPASAPTSTPMTSEAAAHKGEQAHQAADQSADERDDDQDRERDHNKTSYLVCAAACSAAYRQTSFRQQRSHSGLRALQTARPCMTNRWHRSLPSSGGMIFHSAISTFCGSLMPSTRPILLHRRMQWVSVTMAGLPNTSPMIRFALFRPTPGSASSSSKVVGTLQSYRSRSIRIQAEISRAWSVPARRA